MSTILCAGYIESRAMADLSEEDPRSRSLVERAWSEASEGRPVRALLKHDGQTLLRSDKGDHYVLLLECEADG